MYVGKHVRECGNHGFLVSQQLQTGREYCTVVVDKEAPWNANVLAHLQLVTTQTMHVTYCTCSYTHETV